MKVKLFLLPGRAPAVPHWRLLRPQLALTTPETDRARLSPSLILPNVKLPSLTPPPPWECSLCWGTGSPNTARCLVNNNLASRTMTAHTPTGLWRFKTEVLDYAVPGGHRVQLQSVAGRTQGGHPAPAAPEERWGRQQQTHPAGADETPPGSLHRKHFHAQRPGDRRGDDFPGPTNTFLHLQSVSRIKSY